MLRRSTIAIATVKSSVAVAGSFPNWDVTASCRGAASAGSNQTPSGRLESCLASEQRQYSPRPCSRAPIAPVAR